MTTGQATTRHCEACDYWYPLDLWYTDETVLRTIGNKHTTIIRTVECPGCHAITDEHAASLR